MKVAYLIILLFPVEPSKPIDITIVGKYTEAQCDYIKNTYPQKANQLIICANLRDT